MKNFTDLTGRKAIVTGGTRGQGYGMAEGLMEAGAEVVIVGSSAKAEEAVEKLGNHLDILVNAAGVQRRHPSEEIFNGRLSVCH